MLCNKICAVLHSFLEHGKVHLRNVCFPQDKYRGIFEGQLLQCKTWIIARLQNLADLLWYFLCLVWMLEKVRVSDPHYKIVLIVPQRPMHQANKGGKRWRCGSKPGVQTFSVLRLQVQKAGWGLENQAQDWQGDSKAQRSSLCAAEACPHYSTPRRGQLSGEIMPSKDPCRHHWPLPIFIFVSSALVLHSRRYLWCISPSMWLRYSMGSSPCWSSWWDLQSTTLPAYTLWQ